MFADDPAPTAHLSMTEQQLEDNLVGESTIQRVFVILKNPVYVLLVLAISGLYLVVCGLQYWISAYLQIVL